MEKRQLIARVHPQDHLRPREPEKSLTEQAIELHRELCAGGLPEEVVCGMVADWWRVEVSK